MFTEDELSAEKIEVLEELMLEDKFQKGSIYILGELDGDTIYAEVTDVTTAETTTSTYSNIPVITMTGKTFTIYKETLGIRTDLFKVRIECHWIIGEKIVAMTGIVQNPKAGVSYKWNDNLKKQTDILFTLGLDFSYGTKSGILIFGAGMKDFERTAVSITMG